MRRNDRKVACPWSLPRGQTARARVGRASRPLARVVVAACLTVPLWMSSASAHERTWSGTLAVTGATRQWLSPDFWAYQLGGCQDVVGSGATAAVINALSMRGHVATVWALDRPPDDLPLARRLYVGVGRAPCGSVENIQESLWNPGWARFGAPVHFTIPEDATYVIIMHGGFYEEINISWQMEASDPSVR